MRKLLLSLGLCLFLVTASFGQTTLSAGDAVISVVNSDGDDDLYFVILTDIVSGTVIKLTDNAWVPEADSFETDEGVLTWTATSDVPGGTEIPIFSANSGQTTERGTISESGSFLIGTGGDQITIFQGTIGSPTNLYYFDNSPSGLETTDASITGNDDSGLPSGLTEGTNAYVHGSHSADNYQYNCPLITDATQGNILAAFMSSSNYDSENSLGTYASTNCNYGDVEISGNAGWRLLSIPITGATGATISDDGIGAQFTTNTDSATIYTYDDTGAFETISSDATTLTDGFGLAVYFFDNTDAGSSVLPLNLDVSGSEPTTDVSVTLNAGSANQFTLVGNPFSTNYNTNSISATGGNISDNISFWNDGTGTYSAQDRTGSGGYIVAPWQGFWVETSDAAVSSISIPRSGKTTSATTGTFFSKTSENRGDISFTLSSDDSYDEAIRMAFREYATTGFDRADASKLVPMITTYATMAFKSETGLKSVESLPWDLTEEVTVDLELQQVGIDGGFTFDWKGLETIPEEWELTFHDYQEEVNIDMREETEYVFDSDAPNTKEVNSLSILSGPQAVTQKSKSEDGIRFAITITPNTTSVSNETGDDPIAFELEQNYPNPFNPSTTINYTVASTGQVTLNVYNLMGQKVAELVNATKTAGSYNISWDASGAASGMYIYRLEAGGQTLTRKMTLIK